MKRSYLTSVIEYGNFNVICYKIGSNFVGSAGYYTELSRSAHHKNPRFAALRQAQCFQLEANAVSGNPESIEWISPL